MSFKLTVIKGPYIGLVIEVSEESFTIGREDDNDFVIKDIFVSSHPVSYTHLTLPTN